MLPIVSMAAVVTAAPVAAQELGTRIKKYDPAEIRNARPNKGDEAQDVLDAYGACLIQRNRKRSVEYLAIPPGDKAVKAGHDLATSDCLRSGHMRFSGNLLRGALYRALYRSDFGSAQPPLSAKPIDFVADVGGNLADQRSAQYVALGQFAECVVRADQPSSRELTLSSPGSAREKAAFNALRPSFGPCLQQGVNATFNKASISALVAEALYRLSAPSASSAGIQ